MPDFSYIFMFLCQTKYWLCYNALREYVTKIIHSTRSVQNIPNLSNEAFCLYMHSEMHTWEWSDVTAEIQLYCR